MTLQEAKDKMDKISIDMRKMVKTESPHLIAQTRVNIAAVLNEMCILLGDMLLSLPDKEMGVKRSQSIAERTYVANSMKNVEAKREAFIDCFDDDLAAGIHKAEVRVISGYIDALKKNLDALSGIQRALESENIHNKLQT